MSILPIILIMFGCNTKAQEHIDYETLNELFLDLEGNEISLQNIINQYQGKVIFVDIWASWCPDCIKGMPKLTTLQENHPDLVYLFLSYDKTVESWKNGINKYNIKGEHYLIQSDWKKGSLRKSLNIDWIPRYMILDKEGNIALFRAIEADDKNILETLKNIE